MSFFNNDRRGLLRYLGITVVVTIEANGMTVKSDIDEQSFEVFTTSYKDLRPIGSTADQRQFAIHTKIFLDSLVFSSIRVLIERSREIITCKCFISLKIIFIFLARLYRYI